MPFVDGVSKSLKKIWRKSAVDVPESSFKKNSQKASDNSSPEVKYAPPPGPPPLAPLRHLQLPKVLPEHTLNLPIQGWTTVTFDGTEDEVYRSFQELFDASKAFFDRPIDYKRQFKTNHGSEEGWSRIVGEKEFITLRQLDHTPEELKVPATKCWALTGKLLNEMLGRIAESLDLPPDSLTGFSEPCTQLDDTMRAAMLRLFRYENQDAKVVAERTSFLLHVWNLY
jgi:hypothetical protein